MTLPEFTSKLISNSIDKLMVWTGPEVRMMDIYIQQIADRYNLIPTRMDTVQEIMTKIQSKKMISDVGRLYIIRDDSDVWNVENFVNKMNIMLDKDKVLLIYTNMDRRKKFYKEADVVEFDYLSEDILVGYIQNYRPEHMEEGLSEKNARRLVQMCQRDYNRICLEMDKVYSYAEAKFEDCSRVNEAFVELVEKNMIYAPIGDIIFTMTDAVVLRRRDDAYRYLYQLYQRFESPIKIISILYTNFRNLLVVQGTTDGAGIVERTGLTPWQIKLAKEKKGIWSQSQIKAILRVLQDCESGIKNGKYPDDRTAIEVAMVSILG